MWEIFYCKWFNSQEYFIANVFFRNIWLRIFHFSGIFDCKCFNCQEYFIANVPPLNQLGGVPRVHYTHWGPIWRCRKKCFFNLSMFSRKIQGKGKLIFHGFPLSFLHFCPGCIVLWLARIDWKWIWVWGLHILRHFNQILHRFIH